MSLKSILMFLKFIKCTTLQIYFISISESSSVTWTEIFYDNLTLPKLTEKCWLERGLKSHLRDTGSPLYLLSYRLHRDLRRVFIQFKCTKYYRDNLTLIHERIRLSRFRVIKLDKNSPPIAVDSKAQQVEQRTIIPKVQVQLPLESTFSLDFGSDR